MKAPRASTPFRALVSLCPAMFPGLAIITGSPLDRAATTSRSATHLLRAYPVASAPTRSGSSPSRTTRSASSSPKMAVVETKCSGFALLRLASLRTSSVPRTLTAFRAP